MTLAAQRLVGLGLRDRRTATPTDVVRSLLAMQAQEFGYARWSVAQRMKRVPGVSAIDAAFDRGEMLRTHVLRPTWHFVAPEDLPWLLRLSGPFVDRRNARRYDELGLDRATRTRSADAIAAAVADEPRTRNELRAELARNGLDPEGQRLAYMLMHAELMAVVCSGPRRDKQHTYAAFEERAGTHKGPDGDAAVAELARRYFTTRGPATLADFAWWAGLAAADARHAVALIDDELERVEIDGRAAWARADSATSGASTDPQVDLVQCYDEAIISYTQSRTAIHTSEVSFPAPGRVDGFTHVLLLDGQLLGHWREVRSGANVDVEVRLARTVDGRVRGAIDRATAEYERFATT